MSLSPTIWRCIIILLIFSFQPCPLLPVGCQHFIGLGTVAVEPAPPFLLGSNLTVYCHLTNSQPRLEWSRISLELNGETVAAWKEINGTTAIFHLPNVWMPQSTLLCKLKSGQLSRIVNGLDLNGGLPPDKPENITCETTSSSDFIDCSWKRGQETYLATTYNISVCRENGMQVHLNQVKDAESVTVPRGILSENTKYQLTVTAYNHLGASQSDPFILCLKDAVIPETPHIMIEFGNSSAVVLQWKTTEPSAHLRPYIRLHTRNGPWEMKEGTDLSEGLMRVDDLRPLSEYEFQMRTCNLAPGPMRATTPSSPPRSTSSKRSICSRWSPSVMWRSPGIGPSQQLHVWRMFSSHGTNGLRMVTVLWKPPPPEDYSGEVQQYIIRLDNDQKQEVTCTASQRSLEVPAAVQAISVSVVTSYGSSPPAEVPLRHSGVFGPDLGELAPAANGSAVRVSWSWPGSARWSTSGGDLLYYVVEWISVPGAELRWQKVAKAQNETSITGLTAGVRYNISLYAVTTRGVSAPSSDLAYSREQKPVSGPSMSVLVHVTKQILIQWDELPVDQQRGFITNYTVYFQTLDPGSTPLNATVSGSGLRQKWLKCPDGALALWLTASTSAGEGPRGIRVFSQPAAPAAGLVIVIVFTITIFFAIIANLMCWRCVRQRIKQRCVSWGPAWLVENLPKLGNSNAIKLLEQLGGELSFSSSHSDPPLSPISLISWEERDNAYPTMKVEVSQIASGQPAAQTPLLASDTGAVLVNSQLEHVGYKPQIALLASQGDEAKEAEEEQTDVPASGEEDTCLSAFGGLLGGLLSSVEVDYSDSPLGPNLSSIGGLLWPKTPETASVLSRSLLVGRRGTEGTVEVDFPSLESQKGDTMTPYMANACSSQYTVDTALTGGYFPQIAADSSPALCESQM